MQTALDAVGYRVPTPIQVQAIAPAMEGRDVIGTAQTGTGKTAAFMIPIVERLRSWAGAEDHPSALVLAPTRELAEQTQRWALRLGGGLRAALVVGGVGFGPQVDELRRRPSIIVATPGRLVDHLERRTASLRDVRILVLDEADRMLDMGFKPQLDRILRALPAARQTLLFSATLPPELGQLGAHARAQSGARRGRPTGGASQPGDPGRLPRRAHAEDAATAVVDRAERRHDARLRPHQARHRPLGAQAAQAPATRRSASTPIARSRSAARRWRAFAAAATGSWSPPTSRRAASTSLGIGRVINYDLPHTVEDYVHRIGRTARAGACGHASSFAAPEEHGQLRAIERHIGHALPRQKHAGGRLAVA